MHAFGRKVSLHFLNGKQIHYRNLTFLVKISLNSTSGGWVVSTEPFLFDTFVTLKFRQLSKVVKIMAYIQDLIK